MRFERPSSLIDAIVSRVGWSEESDV
jgi:hypothetical protein